MSDPSSTPDNPMEHDRESGQRSWKRAARLPLMLGGPLLLLVVGAWLYLTGGRYESTDDAYVQAARVVISANVGGRVDAVTVHDNQSVHRGDVLFRLDAAPLRIAEDEAGAKLAAARLQVEQLRAAWHTRQTELRAAQDTLAFQQREDQRTQHLLAQGLASQIQADHAAHAVEDAQAQVATATQQLAAAAASLGDSATQPVDRHPLVREAQAVLDRARLNLGYAVVTAPSDGIVTHVEDLQVGSYITPAAPLFALVAQGGIWVEANFKEDQLVHLRVGQDATIEVDSVPGRVFHATVASVSPGTGAQFALLPPENASGNWVKVVQRVPVRLAFTGEDAKTALPAGVSASVRVDTGHRRRLGDLAPVASGAPESGTVARLSPRAAASIE